MSYDNNINITKLPYDVLRIIIQYVDPISIPRLRASCRTFHNFLFDKHVCASLCRKHFPTIAVISGTDPSKTDYFDKAVKQLKHKQLGRPTSVVCVHDVDTYRVEREAETSYDHHFLVYYANAETPDCVMPSKLTILDVAGRYPDYPQVSINLGDACPALLRNPNVSSQSRYRSVTLDHRTVVVSGNPQRFEFCKCGMSFADNPSEIQPYRRSMAVYDLKDYPAVKLKAVWHQVTETRGQLWNICSRDDWVAYTEGGLGPVHVVFITGGQIIRAQLELSASTGGGRIITDLHMTRTHLFIFATNTQLQECRIEVFSMSVIDGSIQVKRTRNILLDNWYQCCSSFSGITPAHSENDWLECWSKFSPKYTGQLVGHGLGNPEERDDLVELTMGRNILGNAFIPLAAVNISPTRPIGYNLRTSADHEQTGVEIIPPDCLITTNLAFRYDVGGVEDYASSIEDLSAPTFEDFYNHERCSMHMLSSSIPHKNMLVTVLYDVPSSSSHSIITTSTTNSGAQPVKLVPRWKIETPLADIPNLPRKELPEAQEDTNAYMENCCNLRNGFGLSGYAWVSDFMKGLILLNKNEEWGDDHTRGFRGADKVKMIFLKYE